MAEDIFEVLKNADIHVDVQTFCQILDTIPEYIFVKDQSLRFIFVNSKLATFLGFKRSDMLGKTDFDFFPHEQAEFFTATDKQVFVNGEVFIEEESITDADGNIRTLETKKNICETASGEKILVGITRDITDYRQAQDELQKTNESLYRKAHVDALSGLLNRRGLQAHIESLKNTAKGARFTLFFMDLNKFKLVNDQFGHHVGDQLLIQACNRLKTITRPNDCLARIGGDEFVMVVDGTSVEMIARIKANISHQFNNEFVIQEQHIAIGVSVGTAKYPEDADNTSKLLRIADIAMYEDKLANR